MFASMVFQNKGGSYVRHCRTIIFGVAKYRATLEKVVARYGIKTKFSRELVEL